MLCLYFFFSSRRRHTRCALLTGVQTCALPICFCEPLGLKQDTVTWDLPVPDEARAWAREQWPGDGIPTLLISPCSSHALRNWRSDRYAAVADHAAARGWRIVLCGGRSELERDTADAIITAMQAPALDLVGKDTLKQLPALLERADLVMTPDSGTMPTASDLGPMDLGLRKEALRVGKGRGVAGRARV